MDGIEREGSGWEVGFLITVTNTGPVTLTGVQLRDDLRLSFPAPVTLSVSDPPLVSGALTRGNPVFGLEDTALLSGTEALAPGESATVRFAVLIELNGATGPFVNQVIGSAFDPDGEPVSDESDQPAEVEIPGCIEGSVFLDLNHNRIRDEADRPASDWDVFIFDAGGAQVGGPLVIASDGHFSSSALIPGDYEVRVINQGSGAVWNRQEVTVQREQCEELEVLLDPQGVVYDSERREAIPGTELSLLTEDGEPLSEQCLLPGQQGQRTDAYGRYRFDVQFGAAADCPQEATQYQVSIDGAPSEFVAAPSTRIPPQEGVLDTGACAPGALLPCIVQQQNDPPQGGSSTDYHLAFLLRPGGGGFANNHIPLDPLLPPPPPPPTQCAEVDVVHVANRARATIGDIVGYRSVLENRSNLPASDVLLEVIPPPGLNILEESFEVTRIGIDGQPLVAGISVEAGREQAVEIGDLAPGESVEVRHAVRISPSANPGTKVSSVSVRTECAGEASTATASIIVEADPMLQKTTVIGKVFHDLNENGIQDGEEPGIPGVRLATLDGLVIETDSHGRYHVADVDTGRPDRGANFMIKLDSNTLPENRSAAGGLRQVVRLTPGLMTRINFPVRTIDRLAERDIPGRFDPFRSTPKLDILALDPVTRVRETSDVEVRFAVYSNYHHYISRYELTFYDVSDPRFAKLIQPGIQADQGAVRDHPVGRREVLQDWLEASPGHSVEIYDPEVDLFERTISLRLPPDTTRIAYRLTAFGDCDPVRGDAMDRTVLRLLDVAEGPRLPPVRSAQEIFGHNSLVQQNIDVKGLRHLVGPADSSDDAGPRPEEALEPFPLPAGADPAQKVLNATYGVLAGNRMIEAERRLEVNERETWAVFDHRGLEGKETGYIQFSERERIEAYNSSYKPVDDSTDGAHQLQFRCGCTTISAQTIVDRDGDSLSLRLTNEGPFAERPIVSFADRPAGRRLGEMPPGSTQELFLGRFSEPSHLPVSDRAWSDVTVLLGPDEAIRDRPSLTLSRKVAGGEVTPDLRAYCGSVTARPHMTKADKLLASIVVEDDRQLEPPPDAYFAMGLVNLTMGANDVSGHIEALADDDHFDETLFVDGRIAGYVKGKIRGRYLITGQIDTTEADLGDLGRALRAKDPDRMFRQLDPDRYYPVYGDDSTTFSDVNSQGNLYLRVDWDRSSAVWGNYNTGVTDTEFSQFNRSLYGAKLDYRSKASNRRGEDRMSLKVFGSEAQTASAHATFRGTGGSLYYLPHRDIVQGSEKLWVEVRARDSEQVLETEVLLPGRDYEMDDLQGRILLSRPLSHIVRERANPVIRTSSLDGDRVFLQVDYEHVPTSFAAGDLTTGFRGRWSGDRFGIGLTSVTEEREGTDYELLGTDVSWHLGEKSFVRAELARSEASMNDVQAASIDGGLTFADQQLDSENVEGDAWGVDMHLDLAEVNRARLGRRGDSLQSMIDSKVAGELRAWHKEKDAGFSAGRLSEVGTYTDSGFSLDGRIHDRLAVGGGAVRVERGDRRQTIVRVQSETDFQCLEGRCTQLAVEGRYEDFESDPQRVQPGRDGEALLLGARLGRELAGGTSVYGSAQTALATDQLYEKNDRLGVGVNQRLSDRLALSLEASDGDRGSALVGGVEWVGAGGAAVNLSGGVGSGATTQFGTRYSFADGLEVYGTHSIDPDRTDGARNLTTLGQRSQLGSRTSVFTETTFGRDRNYADTAHVFGLDYDLSEEWLLSASIQRSTLEAGSLDIKREAYSLGTSYRAENSRLASRIEYRRDSADGLDTRQYLTSTRFGLGNVDANGRWLGKLNLAWTDNRAAGLEDGRFVEFNVGYAYRPWRNDRWNALTKYTFLYDLGSRGQFGSGGFRTTADQEQKSHVLSAEVLYEFDGGFELGGKIAARVGEQRLRQDGDWYDSRLLFSAVRGRYRLPGAKQGNLDAHWEVLAEYRLLKDLEEGGVRHGVLTGLYRSMRNGQLKFGVGYNFTDFDGDLRGTGYRSGGWFVDLIAAY